MNATDNIATDLFYKIRSRFRGLKLGSDNGTITIKPNEARFFDFDYMEGELPIGHVSISLAEPNSMKVYFSSGITESMDRKQKSNWYSFLKELRQFAKRRLMAFDTRDISKDNLDERDFAFLSQNALQQQNNANSEPVGESVMNESAMYGTKTMSFQKLMDTRLIIKHSQTLVDDTQPGARTRHISALFVENQEGERFKYPFIHLAGARAMQRHVANGGVPYDDVGKSIVSMSEQIAQLKSFNNYVVRNDLMNSDTNNIVERSSLALNSMREQVKKLAKQSHYEAYKENFQIQESMDVPDDVFEDFKEKFTVKNFKEDIKSVFPVLYRLMQENDNSIDYDDIVEMTSEDEDVQESTDNDTYDPFSQFEEWAMTLGERSAIQDPDQQDSAIRELQELVGQRFPAGVDGTNAVQSLEGVIDDPALIKIIEQSAKEDNNVDVRPLVKQWLENNVPELLDEIDFGDMQEPNERIGEDDMTEAAAEFKKGDRVLYNNKPYVVYAVDRDAPDTVYLQKPEGGGTMAAYTGGGDVKPDPEFQSKSAQADHGFKKGDKVRFKGKNDEFIIYNLAASGDNPDTVYLQVPGKTATQAAAANSLELIASETDHGAKKSDVPAALRKSKDSKDWKMSTKDLAKEKERNISSSEWLKKQNEADSDNDDTDELPFDPDETPSSDKDQYGNTIKHKSKHLARKGMRQQMDLNELAEFISSFYDRESRTFPKGPEGVATMVSKKFGEEAEQIARKLIERMAPIQSENSPELSRIKELANIPTNEGSGSFEDILASMPNDVEQFKRTGDMTDDLYQVAYDYMFQNNMGGSRGDPYEQVADFVSDYVDVDESANEDQQLGEEKAYPLVKEIVFNYNEKEFGDKLGPETLDFESPGSRVWTRGDGTRYRQPGKIYSKNNDKSAVLKFWEWLKTQPGVKQIGDVSGSFGSDAPRQAVTYKSLYFGLMTNGNIVEWGSKSRITNPRSVWKQRSSQEASESSDLADIKRLSGIGRGIGM
jgi:hypothetical protein